MQQCPAASPPWASSSKSLAFPSTGIKTTPEQAQHHASFLCLAREFPRASQSHGGGRGEVKPPGAEPQGYQAGASPGTLPSAPSFTPPGIVQGDKTSTVHTYKAAPSPHHSPPGASRYPPPWGCPGQAPGFLFPPFYIYIFIFIIIIFFLTREPLSPSFAGVCLLTEAVIISSINLWRGFY